MFMCFSIVAVIGLPVVLAMRERHRDKQVGYPSTEATLIVSRVALQNATLASWRWIRSVK